MREPQRRYSQGQLPGSDAFIAAAVLALLLARAIVFSPDGLVLPQPVRALLLLAATALGARARGRAPKPSSPRANCAVCRGYSVFRPPAP